MKNATASRDHTGEIIKAANAISRLLKKLPTAPQSALVMDPGSVSEMPSREYLTCYPSPLAVIA